MCKISSKERVAEKNFIMNIEQKYWLKCLSLKNHECDMHVNEIPERIASCSQIYAIVYITQIE